MIKYPWDKIYVVNLDKRVDKWASIEKSLKENNIKTKGVRYSAILGVKLNFENLVKKGLLSEKFLNSRERAAKPGGIGQYLSMINVFKEAIKRNYEQILFLEDDQVLVDNFQDKFWKAYNEVLPEKWDILYLATNENTRKVDKLKDKKYIRVPFANEKSKNKEGNNGFIIKKRMMKAFVDQSIPIRNASDSFIVEEMLTTSKKGKKEFQAYVAVPYLIKSAEFKSDIH